jgi:hypothetical protein
LVTRRPVEPGRGVDHGEDAHSFAKERSQTILEQRKLVTLALIEEHARVIEEASGGVAASHYGEEGPEDEIVELGEEFYARLIVVSDTKRHTECRAC